MTESVIINQKVQSRRAINYLESFMTTFGKNQRKKLSQHLRFTTKMNVIEKEVHRDICTKYAGAEGHINEEIEETCCHEKLSA